MQQLLADAQKLTGQKYDIKNLNDVYQAIHVIQTEWGITGTTAKEAGTTISGSINSLKSAWSNLLTGLSDNTADINSLVDNLMTTLIGDGTDSNLGVIGNVLPVVQHILESLPNMITTMIPQLIPVVIETIQTVVTSLLDNLPQLIDAVVEIFDALIDILTEPETLTKLIEMTVYLMLKIGEGLVKATIKIVQRLPEILKSINNGFVAGIKRIDWGKLGLDVLKGILNGMINFGNLVKESIQKLGNGIMNSIKKFFGIASPLNLVA